RQGIALRLLKEYLTRLKDMERYEHVLLIAHEELISLYQKAGFALVGKSGVQHGSRPWFEMRYVLSSDSSRNNNPRQESVVLPSQLPSNVWEALSAPRPKVEPILFTSFTNGMSELVEEGSGGMANKMDVLEGEEQCRGTVSILSAAIQYLTVAFHWLARYWDRNTFPTSATSSTVRKSIMVVDNALANEV
ncbi:hypothetical protein MPER_08806, partial [Moniliophthora perniciosa FA553]